MTDDLHSIVSRLEALDEELAGINADRASVFQDAKRIKLDIPALRVVLAERRRRAKNPAAYEALQGTAAEYRDALDNGIVLGHARAPARAIPQPIRQGALPGGTPAAAAHQVAQPPSAVNPSPLATAAHDMGMGDEPEPIDTDHRSDARPMPEAGCSQGEAAPADSDEGWQARDAAGNYGVAYGTIRAQHVASGQARLDAGDIPSFLDRRVRP